MNLRCFICFQKYSDIPNIFKHLKTIHFLRDNFHDFQCLVEPETGYHQCVKSFKTYDSLRAHVKKCKPKLKIIEETSDTFHSNASNVSLMAHEADNSNMSNLETLLSSCYIYEPSENFDINSTQKPENEPLSYYYETTSQTHEMCKFLQMFSNKISGMGLTNEKTDDTFELCILLIKNYQQFCEKLWNDETCGSVNEILALATDYSVDILSEHKSAYKRLKKLEKNELFVAPEEKAVGTHWEMCSVKNANMWVPRLLQSKMHVTSIKSKIQSLFKQPEFRSMYFGFNSLENRHVCVPGRYQSFCCGKLYQSSEFFMNNPNALWIQLATDGFELCNPLGSKATIHNMTPIYFAIKNVPPEFTSRRKNLYTACLCRTDDLKTKDTDFNNLWEIVFDELSSLEENGIILEDGTVLKGSLVYISFDNLGANSCTGYVESFGATHFCRFCSASKKETEVMTVEDVSKIRTVEEYNEHLNKIAESVKVDLKETKGLKRGCALNRLNNFHILRNKSVDVMHDLNEGAIAKLLHLLFSYCISNKIFDEDWLRKKIQFHSYGSEQKNAVSALNMGKSNLNQTATQLLCLFRNIGFILIKFQYNEKLLRVWECVKSLQTVVQIAYSTDILEEDLILMSKQITIFLKGVHSILLIYCLFFLPHFYW